MRSYLHRPPSADRCRARQRNAIDFHKCKNERPDTTPLGATAKTGAATIADPVQKPKLTKSKSGRGPRPPIAIKDEDDTASASGGSRGSGKQTASQRALLKQELDDGKQMGHQGGQLVADQLARLKNMAIAQPAEDMANAKGWKAKRAVDIFNMLRPTANPPLTERSGPMGKPRAAMKNSHALGLWPKARNLRPPPMAQGPPAPHRPSPTTPTHPSMVALRLCNDIKAADWGQTTQVASRKESHRRKRVHGWMTIWHCAPK